MTTIVRFAPSPTGKLHIGNIRTALINWLFARREGGKFMLRLDDTDLERSTDAFAQGIRDDLSWLGLNWDIEANQSHRFDRYDEVAADLKARGLLYPCYETSEELDRKRKMLLARGKPPIYDRAGMNQTEEERAAFEAEGRQPHWRFKLNAEGLADAAVTWSDLVRGDQRIDLASLSDPVLIREDQSYLYTLPSVIDDIDFKVTHVIRGEDHVTNTGVQIDLFRTISGNSDSAPAFGHHNLLIGADGQALSKRLGALSVEGFREDGLEPLAVLSHSATIGSSDPVQPFDSTQAIADNFAFSKLSRAPARFDPEELKAVNAKLLHETPFDVVADRLEALGADGGETFWMAVRGNVDKFDDVSAWWELVSNKVAPVVNDAEFLAAAQNLLPPVPWDETTWGTWTGAVKAETGAKGRALFQPLRLALTGLEHGPELAKLLPLIGHEKVSARLSGKEA